MTRPRIAPLLLVALSVLVSCTDDDSAGAADPDPDPGVPEADLDAVGTCRGQAAQQEAAGVAAIDWVPLRAELPPEASLVFTAPSLEDLGERDIYGSEDPGADRPRAVRFDDATVLAGELDPDQELLVGRFTAADARAEVDAGAELLVWVRPQGSGPTFASLAALGPDGEIAFLGDCHPGWNPAFNGYAARVEGGLTAAELLTRIVVEPAGPEAEAFRASPEAEVPAGPRVG